MGVRVGVGAPSSASVGGGGEPAGTTHKEVVAAAMQSVAAGCGVDDVKRIPIVSIGHAGHSTAAGA